MVSFTTMIYQIFSCLIEPFFPLILKRRADSGKEDSERLAERFGNSKAPRPNGKLLWCHALGLGEATAVLSVLREILEGDPNLSVILTTNTKTGADGLAKIGLPERVIHQYAPLDARKCIDRFMDHWQPDAYLLAELDLWPQTIRALVKRDIPMVLINGRMTDHRFSSRKRRRGLFMDMLPYFRSVLVQDSLSVERMICLGAIPKNVHTAGLLKAVAAAPTDNLSLRSELQSATKNRTIWLAASTEAREHGTILEAHKIILKTTPDALLIIAPRQQSDAKDLSKLIEAEFGRPPARRSKAEMPACNDPVYLADSVGEMGVWYRAAPVVFIGHSLNISGIRTLAGKNPFEAALVGSVVIHGPNVSNFSESYDALQRSEAAILVTSPVEICDAVTALLRSKRQRDVMNKNARLVLSKSSGSLPFTVTHVREVL